MSSTGRQLQMRKSVFRRINILCAANGYQTGEPLDGIRILGLSKTGLEALHVAERDTLTSLAFAQVQVFSIQPPLRFKCSGNLCSSIPAIQAVKVDCLPVGTNGFTDSPCYTVSVPVHVIHQLLQILHRSSVVGKYGFKIITSLVETAKEQILHVMFPTVEADVISIFLRVGLFRASLLLDREPFATHFDVITYRQDEELPGGKVYVHHELGSNLFTPSGRRIRTYLFFDISVSAVDYKFHL